MVPRAHLGEWRKTISWDVARNIQSLCADPMGRLGYRSFRTEEELRDLESNDEFDRELKVSAVT